MKKWFCLAGAAAALPSLLLGNHASPAALDAVSAASMTAKVVNITPTTATVQYSNDSYDYGYRTLCYDPAPAAAKNNCKRITVKDDKGSFALTGLKEGTKYNYRIEATDPEDGEDPYSVTGNFTTLPAPVAAKPEAPSALPGLGRFPARAFDARGRALGGGAPAGPAFSPSRYPGY